MIQNSLSKRKNWNIDQDNELYKETDIQLENI